MMKRLIFPAVLIVLGCLALGQDFSSIAPFESVINQSYARLEENINVTVIDPPLDTEPSSVVIVVHGLLQSVEEVIPLVKVVQNAGLNTTRFLVPQAPSNWVDRYRVFGPSWYNVPESSDGPFPDDQIINAANVISKLADAQVNETGIPRTKMALVGLSQGGQISLTSYLRHEWAAVLGLSTSMILPERYPAELTNASISAPAFLVHGAEDKIIPIEIARLSNSLLLSYGRNSTLLELEGERHGLESEDAQMTVTVTTLKFLRDNLYE